MGQEIAKGGNNAWTEKQEEADEFIRKALHVYFENQGIVIPNMEV